VIAVQLPPNAVAGDKINVSTPDGRLIEIVVPTGIYIDLYKYKFIHIRVCI
jgi:hypothetical protein